MVDLGKGLVVRIGANITAFTRGMKKVSGRIKKIGAQFKNVGRSLTTKLTLPLTALGVVSAKVFANFEASMNKVAAVSGATGKQFAKLTALARDLGKTTQFSATEAADAMGFLALAGFTTTEVMAALPGTLQLAAAANLDLASSADIVTNILTGMQLPVEQLGRANDVLVGTMTKTNTNLQQLGEAFKFVGPIAASAGVPLEETSAILGLLGNAGIQASLAGTTLRNSITRLLKPSGEAKKVIKELGLQVTDSSGNLLSMVEIMKQLEDAGATTADLIGIFGQRAGPGMAALLSQGSPALQKLIEQLEKSGGIAERIANVQMRGLLGRFREMTSALTDMAISIGSALGPALTALFGLIAKNSRGFSQLTVNSRNVIVALGAMVAVLGPLLLAIGTLVTFTGLTLAVLGKLALVIIGVVALIALMGTAVVLVAERWELFKIIAENFFNNLNRAATASALFVAKAFKLMALAAGRPEKVLIKFSKAIARLEVETFQLSQKSNELTRRFEVASDKFNNLRDAGGELKTSLGGIKTALSDTIPKADEFNFSIESLLADMDNAVTSGEGLERVMNKMKRASIKLENEISKLVATQGANSDEVNKLTRDYETLKQKMGDVSRERKFNEIMNEANNRLVIARKTAQALGNDFDEAKVKTEIWTEAIKQLVAEGFEPTDEAIKKLTDSLQKNESTFEKWFFKTKSILQEVQSLSRSVANKFAEGFGEAFANTIVEGQSFSKQLKSLMKDLAKFIIKELAKIAIKKALAGIFGGKDQAAQAQAGGGGGGGTSGIFTGLGTIAGAIIGGPIGAVIGGGIGSVIGGIASKFGFAPSMPGMSPGMNAAGAAGVQQTIIVMLDGRELTKGIVRHMPSVLRLEAGVKA